MYVRTYSILYLFAQACHYRFISIMLRKRDSSSDLPGGEGGKGEGVTVRHGGGECRLLEV